MRRPGQWAGLPPALAAIAGSIALAAWVLTAASSTEPASAPARTQTGAGQGQATAGEGQAAKLALPLAGNPQALLLAEREKDLLVGLVATPGGPVDLLALARADPPRSAIRATLDGRTVPLHPCGRSCFRLSERVLEGRARTLTLTVRRSESSARLHFRFPARLPRSAELLLADATRRMASLRSVQVDERLTGGFRVIRTRYQMRAPDRLRFQTSEGQRAILIRDKRWDLEGDRWVESPFPGVRAPSYAWEGARNARLIGRKTIDGVATRKIAAYSPGDGFPTWFRVYVGPDGRVVAAEMLAQGHFMTHRFSRLNAPLVIEAPP